MLTELQRKKLPNLFNLHDLDKNGVIEQADFEQFTQMVCDNQGIEIGSSEYEKLNERYMALWNGLSAMADTNQDNQVTLHEWYASPTNQHFFDSGPNGCNSRNLYRIRENAS